MIRPDAWRAVKLGASEAGTPYPAAHAAPGRIYDPAVMRVGVLLLALPALALRRYLKPARFV